MPVLLLPEAFGVEGRSSSNFVVSAASAWCLEVRGPVWGYHQNPAT